MGCSSSKVEPDRAALRSPESTLPPTPQSADVTASRRAAADLPTLADRGAASTGVDRRRQGEGGVRRWRCEWSHRRSTGHPRCGTARHRRLAGICSSRVHGGERPRPRGLHWTALRHSRRPARCDRPRHPLWRRRSGRLWQGPRARRSLRTGVAGSEGPKEGHRRPPTDHRRVCRAGVSGGKARQPRRARGAGSARRRRLARQVL